MRLLRIGPVIQKKVIVGDVSSFSEKQNYEAAYNKKINPTGGKPSLILKGCTPAGYLYR